MFTRFPQLWISSKSGKFVELLGFLGVRDNDGADQIECIEGLHKTSPGDTPTGVARGKLKLLCCDCYP